MAEDIRELQEALFLCGAYPGQPDGSMGPNTKKAIKQFQASHGLTSDGVAGPNTRAKLAEQLGVASARAITLVPKFT